MKIEVELTFSQSIKNFIRLAYVHYIREPLTSVYNFWLFRKEISRFRWWDYNYSLKILLKCLELKRKKWPNACHYKGCEKDAELLDELIKDLKKSINEEPYESSDIAFDRFCINFKKFKKFWD